MGDSLVERLQACFPRRTRNDLELSFKALFSKGKVGKDDFRHGLLKLKLCQATLTPYEIDYIFDCIHVKHEVDVDTFVEAVRGPLSFFRRGTVEYIFYRLDQDLVGYIEVVSLTKYFNTSILPDILGETPTDMSISYFNKVCQSNELPENLCLSILVVDDSKTITKTASGMLSKSGHIPDTASDGKMGLSKMMDKLYDIVIMDIHMPIMDGVQCVSAFREQEPLLQREKQFIVGTSGGGSPNDRKAALQCGMDAFIKKPFSVSTIVKLKHQLSQTITFKKMLDYYSDLSITINDDNEFAQTILSEFLFKIEDAVDYMNDPPLRPTSPKPKVVAKPVESKEPKEPKEPKPSSVSRKASRMVPVVTEEANDTTKDKEKDTSIEHKKHDKSTKSKAADVQPTLPIQTLPVISESTDFAEGTSRKHRHSRMDRRQSVKEVKETSHDKEIIAPKTDLITVHAGVSTKQPPQSHYIGLGNNFSLVDPVKHQKEVESFQTIIKALQQTIIEQDKTILDQQEMIRSQQQLISNLLMKENKIVVD